MAKKKKEKVCIECGCSMADEPKKAKKCTSCKEGAVTETEKPMQMASPVVEEKPAPIKPKGDRVPNTRHHSSVVVYGWPVGIGRYRFGVVRPTHVKVGWEKKMSGAEAYHFLTGVKRKNRRGRLESSALPQ